MGKKKYTKEDKELVKSLVYMRNKVMCKRTFWLAAQEFIKIKYELERRFGAPKVYDLWEELLEVDPEYPDCNLSYWSKVSTCKTIEEFICAIAPEKEYLKYVREPQKFYDIKEFPEWADDYYTKVENMYRRKPSYKTRHDDAKTAKWRKYNNY